MWGLIHLLYALAILASVQVNCEALANGGEVGEAAWTGPLDLSILVCSWEDGHMVPKEHHRGTSALNTDRSQLWPSPPSAKAADDVFKMQHR